MVAAENVSSPHWRQTRAGTSSIVTSDPSTVVVNVTRAASSAPPQTGHLTWNSRERALIAFDTVEPYYRSVEVEFLNERTPVARLHRRGRAPRGPKRAREGHG